MARKDKKKHSENKNPQGLHPEDPGGPGPPGTPPTPSTRASEANTASDAPGEHLAPPDMATHTSTPEEGAATSIVERRPLRASTMEATSRSNSHALSPPRRNPTRHHHDERVRQNIGGSPSRTPAQRRSHSPRTPTNGRARAETPDSSSSYAPSSAAALTTAEFYDKMSTIMAGFSETISTKLSQAIDATREVSVKLGQSIDAAQASTTLVRDEVRSLSNTLKADAKSSRDELTKGLKDVGTSISREISAAIASTSERADNLNQASLQTIIDLLQHRSNVHTGPPPDHTSSPTSTTLDERPGLATPPGSKPDKGKSTMPNPPDLPIHGATRTHRAAGDPDDDPPPTPGPSKRPRTPTPTRRKPSPEPYTPSPPQNPPTGGSGGRHGGGRGGGGGGGGVRATSDTRKT